MLGEMDSGGAQLDGLLASTGMATKGGVEVRILGAGVEGVLTVPGEAAPDLAGPADQINLKPFFDYTDSDGKRVSSSGFCLPEQHWEWFSLVLARTSAAGLLTFAGDRGAAYGLLTDRQRTRLGEYTYASAGMQRDAGIRLDVRRICLRTLFVSVRW